MASMLQRYARLQERLQAESAALSQQRTAQNAKLDSLLSGIQYAPDDPDAAALAALSAQTEPDAALALLDALLARQRAAQESTAAALKDTEAQLDAVQQQLGAHSRPGSWQSSWLQSRLTLPPRSPYWKPPGPRAPVMQAMPHSWTCWPGRPHRPKPPLPPMTSWNGSAASKALPGTPHSWPGRRPHKSAHSWKSWLQSLLPMNRSWTLWPTLPPAGWRWKRRKRNWPSAAQRFPP